MAKIVFGFFLIFLATYQTYAADDAREAQFKQLYDDIKQSIEVGKAAIDNAKQYIKAVVEQETLELDYTADKLREVYESEEKRAKASNKDIKECSTPILEEIDSLAVLLEKCYETDTVATADANLKDIEEMESTLYAKKAECEQDAVPDMPQYVRNCLNYQLSQYRTRLNSAATNIDVATREASINSMECIQNEGNSALLRSANIRNEFLACVAKI